MSDSSGCSVAGERALCRETSFAAAGTWRVEYRTDIAPASRSKCSAAASSAADKTIKRQSAKSRCHFGNAGYNILDSPGQKNVDFGFFRNVQLTETVRLQIRSEFFNALNTPYFGEPLGASYRSRDTLVPDGPRDGEIRGTRTPMRILQFGAKIVF